MNIKYIDTGTLYEGLKGVVVNNSTRISQKNGIPYIEFTPFDEFDWVTLHFSTSLRRETHPLLCEPGEKDGLRHRCLPRLHLRDQKRRGQERMQEWPCV